MRAKNGPVGWNGLRVFLSSYSALHGIKEGRQITCLEDREVLLVKQAENMPYVCQCLQK